MSQIGSPTGGPTRLIIQEKSQLLLPAVLHSCAYVKDGF
jgi:hypothetical protein